MTAAAQTLRDPGSQLGVFDRQVLQRMSLMADAHLSRMLNEAKSEAALVSSASDLFSDHFLEEIEADMYLFWDFLTQRMTNYGVYVPFARSASSIKRSIAAAARAYQDTLVLIASKTSQSALREPMYGEFITKKGVQMGDMRPVLSVLGGGSPDASVPLSGGPATGKIMTEWMSANGIEVAERIWLYGDQDRRTFNGHLQMDGLVFTDWNDEGLQISPQDAWLRATHYRPGDHRGCACIVAPYVPNFGDDFKLSFT